MTLSSIAPLQSTQQTTALNPASGTANKTHQHSETTRQGNDDTATFSAQGRRYAEQNLESHSAEPKFTYENKAPSTPEAQASKYGEPTNIKSHLFDKPIQDWMQPLYIMNTPLVHGEVIGRNIFETEFGQEHRLRSKLEPETISTREKISKLHDEAIEKYSGRSDHTQEENEKEIENFIKSEIKNDPEAIQLMSKLGIDI